MFESLSLLYQIVSEINQSFRQNLTIFALRFERTERQPLNVSMVTNRLSSVRSGAGTRPRNALVIGNWDDSELQNFSGHRWIIYHVFVQEIDVVPLYRLVTYFGDGEHEFEDALLPHFDAFRREQFELLIVNTDSVLKHGGLRKILQHVWTCPVLHRVEAPYDSEFAAFWHDAAA
jgi:hypothetical protein